VIDPCGVCILDDYTGGSGSTTVQRGSLAVNDREQTNSSGSITVNGGKPNGVGGTQSNLGTLTPPATAIYDFDDPLAGIALRSGISLNQDSLVATPDFTGACSPGTYRDVDACRTFNAGVYVITASTALNPAVTVTGSNVLFHFACQTTTTPVRSRSCSSSGQAGGTFNNLGSGGVNLSGRISGTYAGYLMTFDRNNITTLRVEGINPVTLGGRLYGARTTLSLGVSSGTRTVTISGNLVVMDLTFRSRDRLLAAGSATPLVLTGRDADPVYLSD
jgi:hypothetical protein